MIRPNVISPEGIQWLIILSPCEDLSVFDSETTNKTGKTSWTIWGIGNIVVILM